MFGQVPNTTGTASFNSGAEGSMASALRGGNTGVFIASNSVEKGYSPGSDQATTYRNLSFDLSRVSSIYFGSKMQSKALQTLPCIKFWYKPERIKILAVARILNRLRKNLMQKSWLSKHELRSIAPFRQTESCCRWYRFLWNYHREKSIEFFPLHRFWNRCFHRCLGRVPNISGDHHSYAHKLAVAHGAFSSKVTLSGQVNVTNVDQGGDHFLFTFNAGDSNSTYSGTTVQPAALQTLACIRC